MRLGPAVRPRFMLLAAVIVVALLAVAVAGVVVGVGRWATGERPTAAEAPPPREAPAAAERGSSRGVAGTCAGRPLSAPRELRGMWITTVNNIDWPSRPGLDADTVKAEYRGWLDLAQRLNHNAVFVHVRPSGDALWPSKFDPWSQWLTGRRDGQGPGWDPLEFMVAETHARNLEFHAWFNPYRGSQPTSVGGFGPDLAKLPPNHPLRAHPQWAVVYPVKADGSRLYYNPGIPEARRYVEDAMLDAVARYDVDGVHFDDFFYPYPVAGQDFGDAAAFARYGRGFASKAEWRRDNVNRLVREMSQRIKALKPWVKFGISPFGIWRNRASDPRGSPTRGLQSYDDIFADSRLWIRRQWLDYVVPQLYWQIGFEIADYARLLPWWSRAVAGTRVQLYVGQADYRVGQRGAWRNPAELDRQLALNRRYAVSGSVHFSATSVRADRRGSVTRYRAVHYAGPALVPRMTHLPASRTAAPIVATARRDPAGAVTVTWRATAPVTGFAVYRVDLSAGTQPARLTATARRTGDGDQVWIDRAAAAGQAYAYCVAAVDRLWNENEPSAPAQTG